MTADLRGERLLALCELAGITQGELAAAIGVTPGALSQVIKGSRPFPDTWAVKAGQAYRVPVEFFAVVETPADGGVLTFRKKSTARARDEKRVARLYGEAARLFRHASAASGYHPASLPHPMDFGNDPEQVAKEIRKLANVGSTAPIANVTRLCERLGVGVIDNLDPEQQNDPRHSGASRPSAHEDRPLIALAQDLPPGLKRFTIAHELYHLLADRDLERPITSTRDPRELRANRFAGALLLPSEIARDRLSASLTLHGYLRVKADYGVEVRGLIHRAKDLGLISTERERSLYIQWSSNGWRENEPVPVPNERPLLLTQALQRSEGRSYAARLSHEIGVPAQLITHWTGAAIPPAAGGQLVTLAGRRRRS